jgi:DNA-binding response OmpR family regulator
VVPSQNKRVPLNWGRFSTEVLSRLRKQDKTKNTPVSMLNGRNKIGDIEDVFNLGANAYMRKPFSLKKLGDKVLELLSAND